MKVNGWVRDLESHNGEFYAACDNSVIRLGDKEVMVERDEQINSLQSYKGIIYEGGRSKKIFLDFSEQGYERRGETDSICAHDNDVWDCSNVDNMFSYLYNTRKGEIVNQLYGSKLCSHGGVLYSGLPHAVRTALENKKVYYFPMSYEERDGLTAIISHKEG
jgi:hypothetical protein